MRLRNCLCLLEISSFFMHHSSVISKTNRTTGKSKPLFSGIKSWTATSIAKPDKYFRFASWSLRGSATNPGVWRMIE
jgi:hypothetical protein